jgi:hypothetical protein
MNTHSLPGFTAEAALYKTQERYDRTAIFNAQTDGGKVLPQTWCSVCFGNCLFHGNDARDCWRGCCDWVVRTV